jgi:hypothetical protein
LHIFKGTFPDDLEIDRLHLTVLSVVNPVGSEVHGVTDKRHVLQVTGFANGAIFDDSVVVSGEEIVWTFQAPDENVMLGWCAKIEAEILAQRCAAFSTSRFICLN